MTCYKNTLLGPHDCWNCKKRTKPGETPFKALHPDCKNCHHSIGHCQWERKLKYPMTDEMTVIQIDCRNTDC